MAPGRSTPGQVMLIAPGFVPEGGGIDWSMVRASCIIGLGPEGQVIEGEGVPELSGACIHLGVRRSKPEAKVNILFCYTRLALALSDITNTEVLQDNRQTTKYYQW